MSRESRVLQELLHGRGNEGLGGTYQGVGILFPGCNTVTETAINSHNTPHQS